MMQKKITPKSIVFLAAFAAQLIMLNSKGFAINATSVPVIDVYQKPGKAKISTNFLIQLEADKPISTTYEADIANLNLENEKDAIGFLSRLEDKMVAFILDFENKKVTITLHPEVLQGRMWTVSQWNDYFVKKAEFITTNSSK